MMDYALLLATHEAQVAASPEGARTSRQHRLYACLRAAILSGRIAEGTRLASTRTLAAELGMARNSVLYAYEQLAAEGVVHSRRQGTVVARVGLPRTPERPPALTPTLSRRVQSLSWPRTGAGDLLPFLPGTPALAEFPLATWRQCLERAWRGLAPAQMGYGAVQGSPALRQTLAEYLRVSRGVRCSAEQVYITDGTQDSLGVCAHALADADDLAWIENPGYYGARAALAAAGLSLRPIRVDDQGLAPDEADWREAPPRLIYITPSHQYPLGAVMSLERRLSLLAAARAAGAWILEDDYDSEFRHGSAPLPALQGLSAEAPVVYLGTFSKTLFPGLRLGYLVVPPALAPTFGAVAGALMARGRIAEQLALAEFIDAGHYTRHLRRMRRLYAERRAALQGAIEQHLGGMVSLSGGAGGLHLSVRLPPEVPDTLLSQAARGHGMVLRPLSRFALPGTEAEHNGLVLGYGNVPSAAMDGLVRTLRQLIERVDG